jgi:hypothetical protein
MSTLSDVFPETKSRGEFERNLELLKPMLLRLRHEGIHHNIAGSRFEFLLPSIGQSRKGDQLVPTLPSLSPGMRSGRSGKRRDGSVMALCRVLIKRKANRMRGCFF